MKGNRFPSTFCFALAGIVFLGATGWVAYKWGYLQGLIDSQTAAFSAPASVALLDGILPLVAVMALVVSGVLVRRRGR